MSTLSFSRVTLGAFALAASLSGSACEVGRPEGFIPTPREARTGNPDLFMDGGSEPMGNNGDIDDPDFPIQDEDGGIPVPADSPLAKAAGYYWLRTDIEFTYSQQAGFQTLRVFNRASHFALTRLVPDGQVLKAPERTCHIFYQHECQAACSTFTTTVAPDATKLYRAQLPPRVYTLTNNDTMFVTDAISLLLGWTGEADKMPTSLSDPTVWNASPNEADSKGFYVNVRANGLPQVVDCYYNTVERFTSSYSGSLKGGNLDGINAKLSTEGSDAKTLDYQGGGSCVPSNTSPPTPSRSSVRFVKVTESETFWNCPTIADFKAKLADP